MLGAEPPVPPGEGPFRIKGTGYLGHLKWIDAAYPGGRQAFLAAISPEMRRFFEQQFMAIGFNDILPLVCCGHTCAPVFRMSYYDFVVYRSRDQAEQDLKGMYRALLKISTPRVLASRVPNIFAQYLDFGTVKVTQVENYRACWELTNFPLALSEWVRAVYEGFTTVLLATAGGVAPNMEMTLENGPPIKGFPGCKLTVMVQWS
jgi:hypothetical protein